MTAPLALTLHQATLIRDAASKLAPHRRYRFRQAVDDVLTRTPNESTTVRDADEEARTVAYVADGAVHRALAWALRDLRDAAA